MLRYRKMLIHCRAGASVSVLVGIGLAVVVVALVLRWLFASTPNDLLNATAPTPDQIRKIATKLLVHEDLEIRDDAIQKLIESGPDAVPVLKEVCHSTVAPDTRSAALRTLMHMDTQAAAEVMEKLISDPDVDVRRAVANSLGQLNHRASEAILLKALDDDDPQVLFSAIEGCEWKKIKKAVPKLKAALGHGDIGIQEKAARALRVITGRSYEDRINRAGNKK